MKRQAVIFVYGQGGHNAQMQRLFEYLFPGFDSSGVQTLTLNDSPNCFVPLNAKAIVLRPLREKEGSLSILSSIKSALFSLRKILVVFNQYDARILISTGPGISIIPALCCRLLGRQVIHIETWSRFETRSINGRIMYHLANQFYVQNKEQLRFYPKAVWCGRL